MRAESYLARLIKGRPPGRHRRADRKPGRGAQGARVEGAGRARDRPAGHARHADRGGVARRRGGQLAGGGRRARATNGRLPPPTFRPAGSSWWPAAPGELAAELARLAPAETIADATGARASRTGAGKGGFDSLAGERALKARFGVATLDGFGAPARAELAAAGGLLAYLDATQKERRPAARRRRGGSRAAAHMAIDPATRDSLEICRSASRRQSPAACSARSTAASPRRAAACSPRTCPRR